jgi:hypothetical protein
MQKDADKYFNHLFDDLFKRDDGHLNPNSNRNKKAAKEVKKHEKAAKGFIDEVQDFFGSFF